MKRFLILAVLVCSFLPIAFAQKPTVVVSEPFEESRDMPSQIVQCNNGKTFYFAYTEKDGILLTIFDKAHRKTGTVTLRSQVWNSEDMVETTIRQLFEVNSNLVMLMEQSSNKAPVLYRILISTEDGKIVKEEKLASI
jgi:hypothetical protein